MKLGNAGFDYCATYTDLTTQYGWNVVNSSGVSIIANSAPDTGKSLRIQEAGSNVLIPLAGQTGKTNIVGFAFNPVADAGVRSNCLEILAEDGSAQVCLLWDGVSSTFQIRRGNLNGTILDSGDTTLSTNTRHFIEMKFKIDNSTGILDVYVNGNLFLSYSGDTQEYSNNTVSALRIRPYANISDFRYDDFYILNTDGTDFNTYLGPNRRSGIMSVVSDVSVQFTRSAGTTNAENVDDVVFDDGATKNSTTTVGHLDKFELADLSNVGVVDWVTVIFRGGKDVVGECKIKPGIESGATVLETEHAMPVGYDTFRDMYAYSDGVSTPFNQTTLNALRARYARSA